MRIIDKIKEEIAAAKIEGEKVVSDVETVSSETFHSLESEYRATKAYLESRLSAVESRVGIVAPPPVPPAK